MTSTARTRTLSKAGESQAAANGESQLDWFRLLTVATAAGIFGLVIMGGIVRVSGSGLGCPDWPLCHGRPYPPLERSAIIEYTHRTLVSLVGLLVVVTAVVAWLRYRRDRWVIAPALAAFVLLFVQSGIGAVTVLRELPSSVVAAHLGLALLFLACGLTVALSVRWRRAPPAGATASNGAAAPALSMGGWFTPLLLTAAVAVYAQMILGAYVAKSGAGLSCAGFPLCNDQFIPEGNRYIQTHFAHRLLGLTAALLVLGAFVSAWATRRRPALRFVTGAAAALVLLQIFLGALNVWYRTPDALVVLHLANGTLVWALLVGAAVLTLRAAAEAAPHRPRDAATPGLRRRWRNSAADYVNLMKPRIVLLLLIVAFTTMVVAEGGLPPAKLALFTLLGGALAAGAGNAINCYFDRDIDAIMARTRGRPLPARRLEPRRALVFGLILAVVSFVLLAIFVNWWAVSIAMGAILFYTLVYTVWLKRVTPQNIVIGGAAGAAPPLVGWVAVRGELDAAALVLFAIIFYWTPPHFWALALLRSGDYQKAKVPMLPLVVGAREAKRHILLYSVVLLGVTLLLIPVDGMGLPYLVAALVLGTTFVTLAVRLYQGRTLKEARHLFAFSTSYLGLLFAAMVADKMMF